MTAHEVGGAGAGSPACDRRREGGAYPWITRQAKIIVAAEVQEPSPLDDDFTALGAVQGTAPSIQIARPKVVEMSMDVVETLFVHTCGRGGGRDDTA
jgi:hypothetical protein